MKLITALLALLAVFAAVDAQLPGYGGPQYGMMNMGYPPMGYSAYPSQPPPPVMFAPGYAAMGVGANKNANANSNTNVNSNSGGVPGRWS